MTWRLITEDAVTAPYGLAADEVLARRAQPTLRLYTYRSHAALVGRFQNVENEVDVEFCRERGVAINRRPTGGGAILMGEGQLGVALAVASDHERARPRDLLARFSLGLAEALRRLGVPGDFAGRNDVEVEGRKIAGLGLYRSSSGGLLFHASVLVDLDVPLMLRVLETPFEKIANKGIATVEARVTTLRRELGRTVPIDEVREEVARGYARAFGVELSSGDFSEEESRDVEVLEASKYRTQAWIFERGEIPDGTGSARVRMPSGLVDVGVRVAGATIKAVGIDGDFFASERAISELESSLRWRPSDGASVRKALAPVYVKWKDELAGLPLVALAAAIDDAVSKAREPYGCFVTPGGSPQLERSARRSRVAKREAVPPSAASLSSGGLAQPKAGRVGRKVGPHGTGESRV
jgi:lipoate---protein ligase